MNSEWIRDNIRWALGDVYINEHSGFLVGRPVITTSRYRSNPPRFVIVGGRKVRRHSFPLNVSQTRPKGGALPLINGYDYHLIPWRRAINRTGEPFRSWILYCYGDYRYHREQLNVVPHVWEIFIARQSGKRISRKVKLRLQALAWLAVQVIAGEIKGYGREYSYAKLGEMVGVTNDNWRMRYEQYWRELLDICYELDTTSLYKVDWQRREIRAMQQEGLSTTY
ncbi:antitermination protein [Salmonella enterica]|nr:antitermination protein [Salmonella enterica]